MISGWYARGPGVDRHHAPPRRLPEHRHRRPRATTPSRANFAHAPTIVSLTSCPSPLWYQFVLTLPRAGRGYHQHLRVPLIALTLLSPLV